LSNRKKPQDAAEITTEKRKETSSRKSEIKKRLNINNLRKHFLPESLIEKEKHRLKEKGASSCLRRSRDVTNLRNYIKTLFCLVFAREIWKKKEINNTFSIKKHPPLKKLTKKEE